MNASPTHCSEHGKKAKMSARFAVMWFPAITVLTALLGCRSDEVPAVNTALPQKSEDDYDSVAADIHNSDPRASSVRHFCGDCHALPSPRSFPKEAWYDEVRRGFSFYYDSGRTDLQLPSQSLVVSFYQDHAPERLRPAVTTASANSKLRFERSVLMEASTSHHGPAVSFLRHLPDNDGSLQLFVSDMRSGQILRVAEGKRPDNASIQFSDADIRGRIRDVVSNPAVVRQADLDENGIDDFLLTDLGSFLPEDHDRGKLVWIPDGAGETPRAAVQILGGVGRVADADVGDLDSDGHLDIVVAEFGWHKTGGIHVLYNEFNGPDHAKFRAVRLDSRSGPIHVPMIDLNSDGRLDFVALISQEHEVIEVFLNRDSGFEKVRLYSAPDPSFGSSGIELTDFDGDGDSDILYTNGDTFDSRIMKPYHGIWLLENRGSLKFEPHRIADMPGVHRALPADLDGDGDMDIVAAALLPEVSIRDIPENELQAVIWLEQIAPDSYLRHVIKHGRPNHATLALVDINNDQAIDVVAGCFSGTPGKAQPVLEIYRNSGNSTTVPPQ